LSDAPLFSDAPQQHDRGIHAQGARTAGVSAVTAARSERTGTKKQGQAAMPGGSVNPQMIKVGRRAVDRTPPRVPPLPDCLVHPD